MSEGERSKFLTVLAIIFLAGATLLLVFLGRHSNDSTNKNLLDQQQKRFAATATADPILQRLPYGDYGYNIEPTFKEISGSRTLILEVTIVFYESDYRANPSDQQATINGHKQRALDYIKSIGFDPAKYKIEYILPGRL